jgi:hypothetical protein
MIYSYRYPYKEILDWKNELLPPAIELIDHIGGYTPVKTNRVLDKLNEIAKSQKKILVINHHSLVDQTIKTHYSNLHIKFDSNLQNRLNLNKFHDYKTHPTLNYKNFVCSFNGTAHVGRKLLVAILKKFGWFDTNYCSKNFSHTSDILDGHIHDDVSDRAVFYRKFFMSDNNEDFFQAVNGFGHVQYNHKKNIYNLENKLTESFLHIVSETMATSYHPFVTEKFLYSVVTRGLFLAYAQPGWHEHLEKYYGFKRYTKLFDYRFDAIQNPVERLVELISMISKFSVLSVDEWKDLYLLEQNTIEYNYDHYYSGNYLTKLKQYE